jgi:hypothetical protein
LALFAVKKRKRNFTAKGAEGIGGEELNRFGMAVLKKIEVGRSWKYKE